MLYTYKCTHFCKRERLHLYTLISKSHCEAYPEETVTNSYCTDDDMYEASLIRPFVPLTKI